MDWQNDQQVYFQDEEDDPDFQQEDAEYIATKEFVVFVVDAGPDMFVPLGEQERQKSHFSAILKGIAEELKTRIISRESDEVGVCFFNSREKKNIQESEGVYVFSELGIPSAQLIRNVDSINDTFEKAIGSQTMGSGMSKESFLYNVLWVAQAMLRTGTSKNVAKRILLFTNNDDPLEDADPSVKRDLRRTTIQRAKDAQDLGIAIDLYAMNRPGEQFNVNIFYAEIIQAQDNEDLSTFMIASGNKFQDLVSQMRKKIFKKRVVRKMNLSIQNGIDIALRTYAMLRPAAAGSYTWLDSRTNTPLKSQRSYICFDTGAIMTEPFKRFQNYAGKRVIFTPDEIYQVKKVTGVQLQLLGFKPLRCLKDYHNLRPPTFLYPDEEAVSGSTCAFIALHRSMLRLQKYALAFFGKSAAPVLVALVAQEEVVDDSGQLQPPGINMIYLPYSDDIRPVEKINSIRGHQPVRATEEQITSAMSLIKKLDLKDFTVYQIQNPALQKHYAILQALALEEDELPEIKDETQPDEKGMKTASVLTAVQKFKDSVYGVHHDEEEADAIAEKAKGSVASQKRKAAVDVAAKESQEYDWNELADSGKLKNLTVLELKFYLTANKLPLTGKKELLINRILTHLGK